MNNPAAFFNIIKRSLFVPIMTQEEVDGCNTITAAFMGQPLSYTAYALATTYRETGSHMQPIREYGSAAYLTRMYDITGARPTLAIKNGNLKEGDGIRYSGRGYVQLTWKNNYKLAGDYLGLDLVEDPDLALNPDVAAKIMLHGMLEGWFTGKKFSNYLPASGPAKIQDFALARFIINGSDHAAEIAEHAIVFQSGLEAGGWL